MRIKKPLSIGYLGRTVNQNTLKLPQKDILEPVTGSFAGKNLLNGHRHKDLLLCGVEETVRQNRPVIRLIVLTSISHSWDWQDCSRVSVKFQSIIH